MKGFVFLLLTAFCFAFTADNTIPWSENYSLSWSDFQGKPNLSSPYKALTESGVSVEVKGSGSLIKVVIQTYFNKDLSWVKENKSESLLEHERMHFNITEIFARKFRKQVQGKTFSVKTFQRELNQKHKEIFHDNRIFQEEYDKETNHSVNEEAQKKWNKKITSELQNMGEFASVEVTCKLSK